MPEVDIFVNVQGDEPEMTGETVDATISLLLKHPEAVMSTVAAPLRQRESLNDPACVKVVFDDQQRALYFSRSLIPYPRDGVTDELLNAEPPLFYQHMGIYAYRRDFLLRYAAMPRTSLEKTESLEQLRALQNGFPILVGVVPRSSIGIDTPEDYAAFVRRYQSR